MKAIRILVTILCFAYYHGGSGLPTANKKRLNANPIQKGNANISPAAVTPNRESRGIHKLSLHDPLDCLSQVICGLNTSPPQKPSVRSSTANDFAYLLKNAIGKLRNQKVRPTTTTTALPPTTKKTTKAPQQAQDDDDVDDYDEDDIDNDLDDDNDDDVDDYDYLQNRGRRRQRRVRLSVFNRRNGDSKRKRSSNKKSRTKSKGRNHVKKKTTLTNVSHKQAARPLTPLDRLRMEKDLRAKLLSDAQCVNGLVDHTCPFNYQQMLSLISTSLERERTISYTTNKVLPMVGYLIKSRNYTGTLGATFTALERINNYTIEADRDGKPIDFSHILDEVMNRNTGDNGLRIVDTSNDSASASVWEDDEFDHVLQNPYVRRRPSSENYKLAKKKKPVPPKSGGTSDQEADDGDVTSEEDTSEEGLVFDKPRPPHHRPGSGQSGPDGDSSSEEDDRNQDHADEVFEEDKDKKQSAYSFNNKGSLVPPPVFGHIQKNADDE